MADPKYKICLVLAPKAPDRNPNFEAAQLFKRIDNMSMKGKPFDRLISRIDDDLDDLNVEINTVTIFMYCRLPPDDRDWNRILMAQYVVKISWGSDMFVEYIVSVYFTPLYQYRFADLIYGYCPVKDCRQRLK